MSKKEDRIKEAATLHVKIGQLQRYCELMVELGEVPYTELILGRFSVERSKTETNEPTEYESPTTTVNTTQ